MLILSPILWLLLSKCEYQDRGSNINLIYISGFLFCKIIFLFCRSQRIASLKLKFLTWIIESRYNLTENYSDSQHCTILIDHVQFNNETRNKAEPNGCHWEFFNILCGNIFIVFLYFLFSINLLYSEKTLSSRPTWGQRTKLVPLEKTDKVFRSHFPSSSISFQTPGIDRWRVRREVE